MVGVEDVAIAQRLDCPGRYTRAAGGDLLVRPTKHVEGLGSDRPVHPLVCEVLEAAAAAGVAAAVGAAAVVAAAAAALEQVPAMAAQR